MEDPPASGRAPQVTRITTPETCSLRDKSLKGRVQPFPRQDNDDPIELVYLHPPVEGDEVFCFGGPDIGTIKDRTSLGTMRRVHLESVHRGNPKSIPPPPTPEGVEVQSNQMESFIMFNCDAEKSVDVSGFLGCYCSPSLQRLELEWCKITSWDLLSRTDALTILYLRLDYHPTDSTTSKLLSILGSNPHLEKVSLSYGAIPNSNGDYGSTYVSLPCLRQLELAGKSKHVLRLLNRLRHPVVPKNLRVFIALHGCKVAGISQVGLYFQDYIKRRGWPSSGLVLSPEFLGDENSFSLWVGSVDGIDGKPASLEEDAMLEVYLKPGQAPEAIRDLLGYLPLEELVHLEVLSEFPALYHIYPRLQNLSTLRLRDMRPSLPFPEHNSGGEGSLKTREVVRSLLEDILPSLQNLNLNDVMWLTHGLPLYL